MRDADGTPIPNAIVQVQYGVPSTGPASNPPSTCFIRDYCWFAARTDSSGAYDAVFDARQATVFLMPGIAATITALHYSYGSNTQIIPFTQTDVVQNFWIRKPARISAGQSTSVIIDSDSSRCQDGEDLFVLTSRCAYVEVEMTEPGTLVVAARSQVGATPTVYWATSGDYAAPVNRTGLEVSLRVNRGVVTILVGIPAGMPTQRVDVTTTFQ